MARRVPRTSPSGLVQIVRLHWGKSARGGQGARDRNAVAQSFTIPPAELAGNGGHLNIYTALWGERNAFAEPLVVRTDRVPVGEGFTDRCVSVYPHPDGLQVRFQYDSVNGGAPRRGLSSRVLVARPDQWVRVRYNGRFSYLYDGNWYYEQTTVNVAWFAAEPDGRVFVHGEPAQELQALANLW